MSRIEWRSGKNLEPWQVQKLALLKKFKPCESQDHDQSRDQDREGLNSNTNWKPKKILSREAQDGLRLIHESNPKVFGSKELSRQFGISSESVRRILKAGSDPKWLRKKKDEEDLTDQLEEDGSEIAEGVRERQNRRARERLEERKEEIRRKAKMGEMSDEFELKGEFKEIREEVEIERIKEMIRKEVSQDLDLDSSLEEEEEISSTQTFSSTSSSRKPLTQIFYEGLVDPSSSNSSGSSSASETKKSYSKSSPKARGDGEWCLIDAGWCVVHVMTKEARVRWDVESVWERKWRESMREEQERRRKVEGELQEGL